MQINKTYQHHKGNLYTLLHIGLLEKDLSAVAIYRGVDGRIWVRPLAEFKEKFKLVDDEKEKSS